jgi:predicted RNA-binding protein with PIN domain
MPYLIDGHNLIPKLGLKLSNPNDELELAYTLQEFARLRRQQIEVYFDGAPPASARTGKVGTVTLHFISRQSSADSAIRARLNHMGKSAKNWTVVSSDREVQSAAKVNGAKFIFSEEFVGLLRTALTSSVKTSVDDRKLSNQEVEEWLKLFEDKK